MSSLQKQILEKALQQSRKDLLIKNITSSQKTLSQLKKDVSPKPSTSKKNEDSSSSEDEEVSTPTRKSNDSLSYSQFNRIVKDNAKNSTIVQNASPNVIGSQNQNSSESDDEDIIRKQMELLQKKLDKKADKKKERSRDKSAYTIITNETTVKVNNTIGNTSRPKSKKEQKSIEDLSTQDLFNDLVNSKKKNLNIQDDKKKPKDVKNKSAKSKKKENNDSDSDESNSLLKITLPSGKLPKMNSTMSNSTIPINLNNKDTSSDSDDSNNEKIQSKSQVKLEVNSTFANTTLKNERQSDTDSENLTTQNFLNQILDNKKKELEEIKTDIKKAKANKKAKKLSLQTVEQKKDEYVSDVDIFASQTIRPESTRESPIKEKSKKSKSTNKIMGSVEHIKEAIETVINKTISDSDKDDTTDLLSSILNKQKSILEETKIKKSKKRANSPSKSADIGQKTNSQNQEKEDLDFEKDSLINSILNKQKSVVEDLKENGKNKKAKSKSKQNPEDTLDSTNTITKKANKIEIKSIIIAKPELNDYGSDDENLTTQDLLKKALDHQKTLFETKSGSVSKSTKPKSHKKSEQLISNMVKKERSHSDSESDEKQKKNRMKKAEEIIKQNITFSTKKKNTNDSSDSEDEMVDLKTQDLIRKVLSQQKHLIENKKKDNMKKSDSSEETSDTDDDNKNAKNTTLTQSQVLNKNRNDSSSNSENDLENLKTQDLISKALQLQEQIVGKRKKDAKKMVDAKSDDTPSTSKLKNVQLNSKTKKETSEESDSAEQSKKGLSEKSSNLSSLPINLSKKKDSSDDSSSEEDRRKKSNLVSANVSHSNNGVAIFKSAKKTEDTSEESSSEEESRSKTNNSNAISILSKDNKSLQFSRKVNQSSEDSSSAEDSKSSNTLTSNNTSTKLKASKTLPLLKKPNKTSDESSSEEDRKQTQKLVNQHKELQKRNLLQLKKPIVQENQNQMGVKHKFNRKKDSSDESSESDYDETQSKINKILEMKRLAGKINKQKKDSSDSESSDSEAEKRKKQAKLDISKSFKERTATTLFQNNSPQIKANSIKNILELSQKRKKSDSSGSSDEDQKNVSKNLATSTIFTPKSILKQPISSTAKRKASSTEESSDSDGNTTPPKKIQKPNSAELERTQQIQRNQMRKVKKEKLSDDSSDLSTDEEKRRISKEKLKTQVARNNSQANKSMKPESGTDSSSEEEKPKLKVSPKKDLVALLNKSTKKSGSDSDSSVDLLKKKALFSVMNMNRIVPSLALKRKRDETSDSDSSDEKSLRKQLKKQNAGPVSIAEDKAYVEISAKYMMDLDLSTEDEVYLMDLPACINPNKLLNKALSFKKHTKLSTENMDYICKPEKCNQNEITLLIPGCRQPRTIRPTGKLSIKSSPKIEEYKDRIDFTKIDKTNRFVPPILSVKQRHPIFGSQFDESINLEEEVQYKLHAALDRFKTKKKKRKSRGLDI